MHLLTKHLKFASYFTASMDIFDKQSDLTAHLQPFYQKKASIGFVPTMGALHAGHLSLLEQSQRENTCTVISIFVNPTQFNNAEDLARYPHRPAEDQALLEAAGCHALFTPNKGDLFIHFTPHAYDLGGLDAHWEGPVRPGHFQGVVNVVEPDCKAIPPPDTVYQSITEPALAVAEMVDEPDPQTDAPLVFSIVGNGFTVTVMLFD